MTGMEKGRRHSIQEQMCRKNNESVFGTLGVIDCSDVFYLAVVDAEKLIRTGSHVHIAGFPFGTLPVQKLVDRFVFRGILKQGGHDLEQCLTKPAGSAFRSFVAL